MDNHFKAAILANDLDSMRYRIEDLPAHPLLTDALNAVTAARDAVREGMSDLHQREMRQRYDV